MGTDNENKIINEKKGRLIGTINALRFPMIMMIVFTHSVLIDTGYGIVDTLRHHISNPYIAVDYFFLLSGFGMNMHERTIGSYKVELSFGSCIKFGYGRCKKLYPLYIITMLIMIPYAVIALTDEFHGLQIVYITLARIFLCVPLLQTLTGLVQFTASFNSVCWFFSTLVVIYMMYPLLSK